MLRDDEESAIFLASCEKQIPRPDESGLGMTTQKNFFSNLLAGGALPRLFWRHSALHKR